MKKAFKMVLCSAVLLTGMSGVAFANPEVKIVGNAIFDLTPVAEKTTAKIKLKNSESLESDVSIEAEPTNHSKTDTFSPLFGDAYATSTSDSTILEDYIYAKCRAYDGDNTLLNSAEDKEYNSSHAGAKAMNGTAYVGNDYAMGNHTYKEAGYLDVIHETKAEW